MKQIHLAAHFPGVNNTTVWSDPDVGQPDRLLVVRAPRPDARSGGSSTSSSSPRASDCASTAAGSSTSTSSAAPTRSRSSPRSRRVTDRIGLAATLNTTFNEPYELARQFATLDHLSNGRAAWNAVTSPDAFTGENFRRAGFLPRDDRYERAAEFIEVARELWDSHGTRFGHHGDQFDIEGDFDAADRARRATRS